MNIIYYALLDSLMIAYIQGTLVEASPLKAIIEIQGLGYDVHIPITTAEKLPSIGKIVKVYTLAVYREDAQTLYGFIKREERDFFQLIVEKVSGIGPRIAINIMSRLSLAVLRNAIATADTALLAKCPGIGKKTAERLIIELKDKVFPTSLGTTSIDNASFSIESAGLDRQDSMLLDAIHALVTLGLKPQEADKAARKAHLQLGPSVTTEAIIKAALT